MAADNMQSMTLNAILTRLDEQAQVIQELKSTVATQQAVIDNLQLEAKQQQSEQAANITTFKSTTTAALESHGSNLATTVAASEDRIRSFIAQSLATAEAKWTSKSDKQDVRQTAMETVLKTFQNDLSARLKKHQRETSRALDKQKLEVKALRDETLQDVDNLRAETEALSARLKQQETSIQKLSQPSQLRHGPPTQESKASVAETLAADSHQQQDSRLSQDSPGSNPGQSPPAPPTVEGGHLAPPQGTPPRGFVLSPPPAYVAQQMEMAQHLQQLQHEILIVNEAATRAQRYAEIQGQHADHRMQAVSTELKGLSRELRQAQSMLHETFSQFADRTQEQLRQLQESLEDKARAAHVAREALDKQLGAKIKSLESTDEVQKERLDAMHDSNAAAVRRMDHLNSLLLQTSQESRELAQDARSSFWSLVEQHQKDAHDAIHQQRQSFDQQMAWVRRYLAVLQADVMEPMNAKLSRLERASDRA
eukprot:TRINITY_DN9129_c0_g3_i1.p1 TRINITY_DN9129_c0_g3~~TRINITY_DN9129_c0_g3_i1.p1  ORF type:complete len:481 (+),score=133.82 TRINITY_DN9129_c0_g3_i1:150-1592(+)